MVAGFMWFDQKFIQGFDSGWGELYRSLALKIPDGLCRLFCLV